MLKALRTLAWAAACAVMLALPAGSAERRITMNFKDAELEAVVQFISEVSGKNFILDEKVRGKVTVISPAQVTPDEAYEVFQAILGVKGFTIVPAGKVNKIVATREAKQTNIETVQEGAPSGDRFVTRLLPLKHVEAEAVAGILAPLVSKDSSIVAYAPTNTLILTDAYSNIERLIEILGSLDVPTVDVVLEIIHLKFAAAESVAKNLAQAVVERGGAARRRPQARAPQQANVQVQADSVAVKIIPDARTNSLILIADPSTLADLKTVINALDVEIPKGSGKINVYYLKYADAESVAATLTAISKSAGAKGKPGQPAAAAAAAKPAATVSVEFEEPVQITADKATNSLVIIASPQDYEILRGVIEKLDIRRPQVLVEALVVEMSYDKSLELGVEWRTVDDISADRTSIFAATNFGQLTNLATGGPLALPSGVVLGAVKGTIKFGTREFLNVGALIRALQGSSDANVLSTPHVLTTDNEEAEIVVSDNIPFKTSEKFDSNGNPISTFEYRDVGLTLRLTPQINEDEFVKLKIFQEVSDIVDTATGGSTNAPRTTKRSAKTTIVVQDAATVVIGGLVKDSTKTTTSSVPCLGDLPLLGYLFRSSQDTTSKTNLLIFLTPHIIRNTGQMEAATRGMQQEFHSGQKPAEGPAPTLDDMVRERLDKGRWDKFKGAQDPAKPGSGK